MKELFSISFLKHGLLLVALVCLGYLISLLFLTPSARAGFKIFHYNIRELDSAKLQNPPLQLQEVKKILQAHEFDLLSINEIQHDLPGVPSLQFQTQGQNLSAFARFLGLPSEWSGFLSMTNTGEHAQKGPDGAYSTDTTDFQSRKLADPFNFGLYPGQYSTGLLTRFKILETISLRDLAWKDFHPERDLTPFRGAQGQLLPPSMPLFDKSFSDIVLEIEGRIVHFILFHAVPAHDFGDRFSPNYVRNQDQLRFLEWYLTGTTDTKVNATLLKEKGIVPLKKEDLFLAAGDWNTDWKGEKDPGGAVLRRLFQKVNLWMENPGITFETGNFKPSPLRTTLDYIIASPGINFLRGGIIRPFPERENLYCKDPEAEESLSALPIEIESKEKKGKGKLKDKVLVEYYDSRKKQICYDYVAADYYAIKMASDHFPLWAEFEFSR